MKLFQKWCDSGLQSFRKINEHSTSGTPLGERGEGFREFMADVDGFEPGADAYVYAVVLRRKRDGTRWYYVGQTTSGESGLQSRFVKHVRGKMTKTVQREGIDVLDSTLSEDTNDAYVVIGVERAEPVSVESDSLEKARVLEREREMAYEIAIEYETKRVLGGA